MTSTPSDSTEPPSTTAREQRKINKTKPHKIRAELNIEKWPAIWQPSSSKRKPTSRILEREFELSNGQRVSSRLEVGFTQHGTVTTEDQKMFYALVKQWEDSGKPTSVIYFSDRLLQRLLKKKWGTNVLEAITGSLRRLRATPFTWTRSFRKNDSEKSELEEESFFTLLADLKIVRRKTDGHVTNQQGYFQFDKNILDNLLSHYTKPLYLDDLFRFKSEVAQLIYVHVDLILANKPIYERKSKELFDDLGLRGESYRYPSNRKQVLSRALKELQGARLSTGVLKSATLEQTNDKQDYKVVFRKGAVPMIDSPAEEIGAVGHAVRNEPTLVVNNYAARKDSAVTEAEQLVRDFHELFHGVGYHVPQSKETSQALALIAQHGPEQALHILQFAKTAAAETGFRVQTIGGILQYTSRALADYERTKKSAGLLPARMSRNRKSEPESMPRGRRRFAGLTPEQYDARFQTAKVELQRRPYLAGLPIDGKLFEAAVRALMIEQLDHEPMELLPFDPGLLIRYPWLQPPTRNFTL